MSRVPSDSHLKTSDLFKKRLNELIADLDCSIYEFAPKAHVSKGVITRATIYGIIPSVKPLIKIADTCEVSLEYLLGLTNETIFSPSILKVPFHIRINELRLERGVKFSQIGKQMPFSTNLFYDWQREHTLPSLEYLLAIANYFEVSIDYLLGRTDDKTN
ncbi:hypothetical protein ESZ91_04280 [Candidatus Borkfalkia ceftriaxoniphila]|jgi:phage transcriptional regulator|uniref:HTH cro/C1-type domain-containing protein n=1 Tax=Candidatus Borkfalkia ceftriaxoniphila TaxID=2508949 RepID=A0A4Q2KCK1_9FIRM|nr:helix-turn-helix transcriptional regulator [Candidatus Borkfalkia ceftriaxoniphila]RXZ61620.1 hypothetical protein ESZ91_04280 [Candidatus Borkfalkia ceftriaxoniphila]